MTDAVVKSEPLTYRKDAPFSFYRDLVVTKREQDAAASARLAGHATEMRVEMERLERRASTSEVEYRTNPNRIAGQGGYAAPPLWLLSEFATYPRPVRVLAAMIPTFLLPKGVQSVNLPRLTTGSNSAPVADGAANPSRDIADALVTSPVITNSGSGVFPLSMLEQTPAGAHLDWVIFKDLAGSYDHKLETALITGTGTNGQFYGLLNIPVGATLATAVTYTDGSPTAAKMFPYLGQAAAGIGNKRNLPPEVWLMSTSRWAWIGTGEDLQGLPLAVPGHTPPPRQPYLFDDNVPTPVSSMLGWPIYPADAVPANLGTTTNQDAIIACRPSDMLLLESERRTMVDFESLSGALGVRLQLIGYIAALLARYPTGVATVTGSGTVVQPGF